ncbi:MAG: LacI family DNA-binding transcriptional regulator [Turicibacter sp.]|nr:LacI family DNA-binding transcriptional regulator [Turicibacter sp.]
MATIKAIAEKSGFSVATVSRVLSNDSTLNVLPETRDKITKAALELDYKKGNFQPLVRKIAFLYWITDEEELQDLYFKEMRLEVESSAGQHNVDIDFYSIEDGIECVPRDLNGFIAVGAFKEAELEYLKAITHHGVFLDSSPDPVIFDSVRPDMENVVKAALDFFITKGHQKIGFIGGGYYDPNTGTAFKDIRETEFRNYSERKGVLNEEYIFGKGHFTVENGYELMRTVLDTLGEELIPSAFFIASDVLAVGCLQLLNERHVAIPQKISILSVNDMSVAKYVSPPLSTFRLDIPEMCKTAIKLLLERINDNRDIPKSVFVGATLIARRSSER